MRNARVFSATHGREERVCPTTLPRGQDGDAKREKKLGVPRPEIGMGRRVGVPRSSYRREYDVVRRAVVRGLQRLPRQPRVHRQSVVCGTWLRVALEACFFLVNGEVDRQIRPFLIRGKMVDGGKPHVVKKNAHWGFG